MKYIYVFLISLMLLGCASAPKPKGLGNAKLVPVNVSYGEFYDR